MFHVTMILSTANCVVDSHWPFPSTSHTSAHHFQFFVHSNLVFLDFAEPPQFIQKLPSTTFVKLCEGHRFECKATSSHYLKMCWYKNDQKITEGSNYKIMLVDSTSYLQLHTTRFEDNGVYTCEAQNDAGCVSCSTVLVVQGQLC